jgi:hypothetical protein
MDPPKPRRVRTADGEREMLMDALLRDYFERRDDPDFVYTLDWDDLLDLRGLGLLSTDDDDSDFSDY